MRFNLSRGHQGTTCYVPSLNVKIRENLKIYYLGKIHFVLGLLPRNSMLRTTSLTESLNPLSKMEFYGGHKRDRRKQSRCTHAVKWIIYSWSHCKWKKRCFFFLIFVNRNLNYRLGLLSSSWLLQIERTLNFMIRTIFHREALIKRNKESSGTDRVTSYWNESHVGNCINDFNTRKLKAKKLK